jgi:DNA-binding LacI/PurR family transcriptional regulator
MVRLTDIARKLNVSPSTVSRALNNKGRISPKLRQLILDTADEFQYQPNEYARFLKTNQTTTIGVILPDISNIFFGKLLKGIDATARNCGYSVIFCDSDEALENERDYYDMLKSKNVCGIVVAPAGVSDIYSDAGPDDHIVFIDSSPSGNSRHPVITIDNYRAAYELTEHLVSLGRRRMDIIAGPRCETSANDRVRGFLDCLLAHGLPTEGHVFECEHDYDSGVETMRKILSLHKPDAIFTENNLLAYGAFSVIRANGLTVPNDISLACFDASDDFGMMSIAFTTILQPVAEFGRKAVELIVGMNDAQQAYDGPMEIIMEYSFQRGQST